VVQVHLDPDQRPIVAFVGPIAQLAAITSRVTLRDDAARKPLTRRLLAWILASAGTLACRVNECIKRQFVRGGH